MKEKPAVKAGQVRVIERSIGGDLGPIRENTVIVIIAGPLYEKFCFLAYGKKVWRRETTIMNYSTLLEEG